MLNNEFDDEPEPLRRVKPTRRDHRSRRIDVMRELESGVVDERPVKERFSREFKNPRIKKIKDPLEKIDEKDCVEGLVVEVHRRTCEVRLDSSTTPNGFAQNDNNACYPRKSFCIGRMTESAAQKHGFETVTSDETTMDSLVKKIVEFYT